MTVDNNMTGNDYFLFFLESSTDFIYFKDKELRFTYVSRPFLDLLQIKNLEDIVGKTDFDVFDKAHATHYRSVDEEILTGKVIKSLQETYYNQDGELCWISTSKTPIYNDSNEVIGMFGISRDITRMKDLETETKKLAQTDDLTGLYNRNYFFQKAKFILNLVERTDSHVYMLFVDIDKFKEINDNHGHPCGDFVLKEVASRLKMSCRKSDVIARYGGDEFLILATTTNNSTVKDLTRRINELLRQTFLFEQTPINLSCSIGVSRYPTDATDLESLIEVADEMMYQAKALRKGITVFSPKICFPLKDE